MPSSKHHILPVLIVLASLYTRDKSDVMLGSKLMWMPDLRSSSPRHALSLHRELITCVSARSREGNSFLGLHQLGQWRRDLQRVLSQHGLSFGRYQLRRGCGYCAVGRATRFSICANSDNGGSIGGC